MVGTEKEKFAEFILRTEVPQNENAVRRGRIYDSILRVSRNINKGNFTAISGADIRMMFDFYDGEFFGGNLRRLLGGGKLRFYVSKRMTKAAGKTMKELDGGKGIGYAIGISSILLFDNFKDENGMNVSVAGIICHDRMEAVQRIMEHEIIHLIEILIWGDSDCSAGRFFGIAQRFFGHKHTRHQMITRIAMVRKEHGILVGSKVFFECEGKQYCGVVNRITRRATVLVENEKGHKYNNGKRYDKFYVPIGRLRRTERRCNDG